MRFEREKKKKQKKNAFQNTRNIIREKKMNARNIFHIPSVKKGDINIKVFEIWLQKRPPVNAIY